MSSPHLALLEASRPYLSMNLLTIVASLIEHPFSSCFLSLTAEQQAGWYRVMHGQNLLVTGNAGAGKSHLMRSVLEECRTDPHVLIVAPTGCAAVNIGGVTLHSAFGLGVRKWTAIEYIRQVLESPDRRRPMSYSERMSRDDLSSARMRLWNSIRMMVIDEISMVSADLWDMLESVARYARHSTAPFGGIQLVVSGDFLQLPPISSPPVSSSSSSTVASIKMAFEARSWLRCFSTASSYLYLQHSHRQSDPTFLQVLNEVRYGQCSAATLQILQSRLHAVLPIHDDGILPTLLYPYRKTVEVENQKQLEQLSGDEQLYRSIDKGHHKFLDGCRMPSQLQLKVGAQVMYLVNDFADGLYNGLRGRVVTCTPKSIEVLFHHHSHPFTVNRHTITIYHRGKAVASRKQYPLCLAYAMTIHKSQGASLSKVQMQLNGLFEVGQFYTALSRAVDLSSLSLSALNLRSLKVHPKAMRYTQLLRDQYSYS